MSVWYPKIQLEKRNGPAMYAIKKPSNITPNVPTHPVPSTLPIDAASRSTSSNPWAIASIPNNFLALSLALFAIASRWRKGKATISRNTLAHTCGSGVFSHPVRSSTGLGSETTLSVGPPESHASTGSPHAIASTGTIPKCSFAGV